MTTATDQNYFSITIAGELLFKKPTRENVVLGQWFLLIRTPFSGHYFLGFLGSKDDFCILQESSFLNSTAFS